MELVFIQTVRLKRWAGFSIFCCLVPCSEITTCASFKLPFCKKLSLDSDQVLNLMLLYPTHTSPLTAGVSALTYFSCQTATFEQKFCSGKGIRKVLVFIPVWNSNQTLKPQNFYKMEFSSSHLKGLLCVLGSCKITRSQFCVWDHVLCLCVSGNF